MRGVSFVSYYSWLIVWKRWRFYLISFHYSGYFYFSFLSFHRECVQRRVRLSKELPGVLWGVFIYFFNSCPLLLLANVQIVIEIIDYQDKPTPVRSLTAAPRSWFDLQCLALYYLTPENIKCRTQLPGMATLKPLLALKSSALKSLAASLGVSSTGTKLQLASQIVSACCETVPFFERPMLERQPSSKGIPEAGLDSTAPGTEGGAGKRGREKKKDKRVLSIDMGIRNLAMCVLEVPDSGLRKSGSKRKVAKSLPKLLAWERVVVAKKPVAEVEESMLASPEKLISKSKSKRSLKKARTTESLPPEGEEATPKSKSRSKKRAVEATEAENPSEKEQLVEKEKFFERKGNETKAVAEELEDENMLKKGETSKVPGQEETPLEKKGNEPAKVAEELPEDEQRILDVPSEQETPKSKSMSKKVKVLAEETGVAGEPLKKDQVALVRSEEATPEVTEVTELLSPSGEQGGLELKKIHFEEAIPDGKIRSRKGGKALLPKEELKAPKQEELHEIRLGSKSRSRKGKKVVEAQSPEELVFPIVTPNTDLDETPQKGGRVKKKPKKKAESFEPSVYALLANTFVRHLLNRFSPLDAVLIERQRYRSNSAPAIQEWTVRVNMFESMLHAIFCCLHGKESPVAESVSPNRVTKFWLDRVGGRFLDIQKPKQRKKKEVLGEELGVEGVNVGIKRGRTCGKTKLAKVSLVKEWLQNGDVVSLGKDVRGIAADFGPVKGRRKANSISGGKLDDLADCLLQGIAWIRWEENRKSLAEGKLVPEFIPCANSKS